MTPPPPPRARTMPTLSDTLNSTPIPFKDDASQIRLKPWSDSEQEALRAAQAARKIEENNQKRPRWHRREMGLEEARQKKVESKWKQRADTFDWLVRRVKEGRLELLRQSRLTGIEKEARLLWADPKRMSTRPGVQIRKEVYS